MSAANVSVKSVSGANKSFNVCTADMLCPYCGYYAEAQGPIVSLKYALIRCHRCGEAVMIQSEGFTGGAPSLTVIDYHPKRMPTADPFVPKDIAEDYLKPVQIKVACNQPLGMRHRAQSR